MGEKRKLGGKEGRGEEIKKENRIKDKEEMETSRKRMNTRQKGKVSGGMERRRGGGRKRAVKDEYRGKGNSCEGNKIKKKKVA